MDFTLVSSKIVEIFKMIFKYKEIAKESRLKVLKEMERSLKRYISQATMMTKWNHCLVRLHWLQYSLKLWLMHE